MVLGSMAVGSIAVELGSMLVLGSMVVGNNVALGSNVVGSMGHRKDRSSRSRSALQL